MVLSVLTIVFTIILVAVAISTCCYVACCHYGSLSRPHLLALKGTIIEMMNSSIQWINHSSADKY